MIATYPSPGGGEEYTLAFARDRACRVLILPALFDEANKLRHFTVEAMRRLDKAGIDCFLPDLPGCNESLAPLEAQTLACWRDAASKAARHFAATHTFALRGGFVCDPGGLPSVRYAPTSGLAVLRALVRARVIASQEAGSRESSEELMATGRAEGLELAGYRLGSAMICDLEAAPASAEENSGAVIAQAEIGGAGLWLRAEPGHDPRQADALAALITSRLS